MQYYFYTSGPNLFIIFYFKSERIYHFFRNYIGSLIISALNTTLLSLHLRLLVTKRQIILIIIARLLTNVAI